MTTTITRLLCLSLLLTLTGCGYLKRQSVIQGRDQHYLTAKSATPLRMPPGTSSQHLRPYYPIAERSYPESQKTVNITPPGLTQN